MMSIQMKKINKNRHTHTKKKKTIQAHTLSGGEKLDKCST